jgi:hypothetical protein
MKYNVVSVLNIFNIVFIAYIQHNEDIIQSVVTSVGTKAVYEFFPLLSISC